MIRLCRPGITEWVSSPNLPSRVDTSWGRVIIACTTIAAASSGLMVGKFLYMPVGAIIGVRTNGMCTVVMLMPSATTSEARQREYASSAALLATYAAKRGGYVWPPIDVM